MEDGVLLLVVLAALGALLLVGLAYLTFSRLGDEGRARPIPAGYREGDGPWRRGTLAFVDDRVTLRGPGGLSAGPWLRGNLDLGIASPLPPEEGRALGREGLIQVPVTYGTSHFVLALDEERYTALRAWVEAVPPGWNNSPA